MGQRAPWRETIPLCYEHHRGATGVHGMGTRGFARRYGLTETDLLEHVDRLLSAQRG